MVDHVRTRPYAEVVYTSVLEGGPACPLPFYLAQGFRNTGRSHDDELVLALDLTRN